VPVRIGGGPREEELQPLENTQSRIDWQTCPGVHDFLFIGERNKTPKRGVTGKGDFRG